MNKKLIKLVLLLSLTLSLVACGEKKDSTKKIDSSTSSTNQVTSNIDSSSDENVENPSYNLENSIENDDTQKELTEEKYYDLIKEAWQEQKDYIDSIDDPNVKQSLQTAHSAAIFKSNELLLEHPEDSEAINSSLKKVLAGE